MADENKDSSDTGYDIVRSASPSLVSATNKLSTWVTMKIELGWIPLGPPLMHKDDDKYYFFQAMTK
jgi:hypothetical protein